MTESPINLFNLDQAAMIKFFVVLGEKSFRGTQMLKWLHQLGIRDFSQMTNFSLALRDYLAKNTVLTLPKIISEKISLDGTKKWLLELEDGNLIETVFIPEDDRGTLCISTQVGCPLQCGFCRTGELKLKRNLTVSEIIGQLWLIWHKDGTPKKPEERKVTNVVLMGMGEPLLNLENVLPALNLMLDDNAYGLSKYRVTVSTAGIIPALVELSEKSPASLAISLHAADDQLRSKLMPINKKYPLVELLKVAKNYFKDPRRKVTFEYILIDGVNDSIADAKKLVKLIKNISCKVNLIPFNESLGAKFKSSKPENIEAFRNVLLAADINTITRKKRGVDIEAACGQLAAQREK
jgi:23S rRNA (adenine2503-C2)-methyltransferase